MTPVSFPLAKLLKEKGFDEPCSHAYKEIESPVLYIHQDKKYNNSFKQEWQNTMRKNSHMDNAIINRYSAPTIAEVVMWLYEKHGVWIVVDNLIDNKFYFSHRDTKTNNYSSRLGCNDEGYELPTEAYEAAIEYCLTKLI